MTSVTYHHCSYCGARALIGAVRPEGHEHREDGTLTCPKAVDRRRIDELFRRLYEVTS